MSWDFRLLDPVTKETAQLDAPHHMRGGTYAVGGTTDAELNVTYNYSKWYYKVFPFKEGIRGLDGVSAADSISVLKQAIQELTDLKEELTEEEIRECKQQGADGYWLPTRENAIRPLYQLLALAKMRPDAIWEVC